MPLSPSPIRTEPERGLALQKYLLLHSQHDALQKHLDRIMISSSSPSLSPSSSSSSTSTINSFSSSPDSTSPSTSFSTHPHHNHHNHQRPNLTKRRSSLPTELYLVEETIDEHVAADLDPAMHDQIATQEHKLRDVNLQIKTTLTELLGCESVRLDKRYRTWVQTRLMGAEQELKGERRAATRARGGSWVA